MADGSFLLAFDKSVRSIDADGRLHVSVSNISKATVNPYRGAEIPDWENLGLEPGRVYMLFRDPEELARAAPTFNNLQILSTHKPVNVDEPAQEITVGSTGTDAAFAYPYLTNSLVFWVAEAVADIETRTKQELSCAYRYVADMTPGTHEGLRYDGIMRNIVGNHVALVEAGRAGSDVVVGDSKLARTSMLHSRSVTLLKGALLASARPLLAADAAVDFGAILGDLKGKTFAEGKTAILAALKPKLAKDAKLEVIGLALDAMEDDCEAEDEEEDDKGEEDGAEDEDPDDDKDDPKPEPSKDKKAKDRKARDAKPGAMDAAIAAATKTVGDTIRAEQRAIRDAERAVRPYVGDVAAMDSADDVYKFALDQLGVDTKNVHPSAFPALLKLAPKPNEDAPRRSLAQDADTANAVVKKFPALAGISRS